MVYVVLAALGLCFGSFINALVWRLRQQEVAGKKSKVKSKKYSVTTGRSMCVHCHHVLAWYDLLPVVSWLALNGKCRYCKKPISIQYPLVEVATASLFILSYHFWPHGWESLGTVGFGLWLAALVGLVALVVYDLRWMLLPNKIVYVVVGLAASRVLTLAVIEQSFELLLVAVQGLLALGGFFYVLFQVSNGKWIGGGDVKLGFGLGLIVGGPLPAMLVLFLASLMGSLVSLPLIASKSLQATSRIPFGPFLIIATILVYLFGAVWIAWLKRQLIIV